MSRPLVSFTLSTGQEVPEALVRTTRLTLSRLLLSDPIAFYELGKLAQDPQHELWGNTDVVLRDLRLIGEDGSMQSDVREVVRACVVLDGLNTRFVDPMAQPGKS